MDNMNTVNGNMNGIMPVQPIGQNATPSAQQYSQIGQFPDLKQFPTGQQPEDHPISEVANKEKRRIAQRLQGFNPKDNPAWYHITQKFGSNIKQPELLSIAEVCANSAGIKLDRDAKRRKSVLIKWFEENWPRIQPFLNFVVLEDTNKTQQPQDMQQQMMQMQQAPILPM